MLVLHRVCGRTYVRHSSVCVVRYIAIVTESLISLNFICVTTIAKQVIQLILIMLVGTDV